MGCCFGKSEEELPPAFDPVIGLCSKHKGSGVIVEGPQLSGTGSIFGDSPILQDKAYFEVTLVKPGTFAVGVCSQRDTPLDSVLSSGSAASAWTLTNNSSVPLAAGETIGIAFDQADYPVQLYFYKEGKVISIKSVHALARARTSTCALYVHVLASRHS